LFLFLFLTFQSFHSYIITMSYQVQQRVGNHTYLYEVTSFWDKQKRQARQKRIILGKIDAKSGKLIPTQNQMTARTCRDFGNFHLLQSIAQETGLLKTLQEVFPHHWQEILTCAFYEVSERKPMYLCEPWSLATKTIDNLLLSSQRISELLQDLGKMDSERLTFFHQWTRQRAEREYLAFDITSISSYSQLMEYLEFGYNRDGEDLPQVNLGILFGQTSLLPIFYRLHQGSIRDMSTLATMLEYVKEFGMKKIRFVFDKGFYSDHNLAEMLANKAFFTISVPFTTSWAKRLVENSRSMIGRASNTLMINGDMINVVAGSQKKMGHRISTFVAFNEHRYLDAKKSLLKNIFRLEKQIEESKRSSYRAYRSNPYMKYLKVRKTQRGIFIQRREEKIAEALRYRGYLVIISNDIKAAPEILQLYRAKDSVEKAFDNLKNELDLKRLRVHSDEAMNGRLFIGFISLILLSWIDKKMKEKNLYKYYTQEEVMAELKRLKIIELSKGKKILTELSKKQTELFAKFEVALPTVTSL
jgi:transposase